MIDTKALRSRVLDLAIQGKLTEQLESDGEASDNCNGIKMQSVSAPFSIPNNWKWTTIGNIISKDLGGGTPSKTVKEYWEGGTIPWMSVKDFSSARNGILEDTKDHITELGLQNSTSNLIDTDAIIICVRMGLGRLVKLKKPTAINQDLRAIWLSDCIDREYFMYFYSTLRVEGHGMTVSGIKKQELMNFRLPLPPLAEQKRIVARVEEIFRLLDIIDAAQAQYAADAESLKAKLITLGIQGRLTEQLASDGTAEELYQQIQADKQKIIASGVLKGKKKMLIRPIEDKHFDIPSNWRWIRLGDVSEVFGRIGFRGYTKNDIVSEGEGALSLSPSNITTSGDIVFEKCTYITWEKYEESPEIQIKTGDILIVKTGSSYGKCCIADALPCKATINPQLAVLKYVLCNRAYLKYALNSIFVQQQFESFVIGAATPTFSQENLANVLLPLPPLAEQKRIAETLERVLGVL